MQASKARKIMTFLLLGVTVLAAGCGGTSTPKTVTIPASVPSASPTASKPAESSSSTSSTSTTKTNTVASTSATNTPRVTSWKSPPAMQIDKSKKYFAVLNTSLGSFKIELFASESPNTVNNFVFLAKQNYYNGIIFHRIIKDFMIQTGDPTGTGSGGPGYQFKDELPVKHSYEAGIVAMANAGANTNGSQFFVCTGVRAQNLNSMPNYSQFGKVIEGMENVMKIASVEVVSNGREVSKPVKPPVINSIEIIEQ